MKHKKELAEYGVLRVAIALASNWVNSNNNHDYRFLIHSKIYQIAACPLNSGKIAIKYRRIDNISDDHTMFTIPIRDLNSQENFNRMAALYIERNKVLRESNRDKSRRLGKEAIERGHL